MYADFISYGMVGALLAIALFTRSGLAVIAAIALSLAADRLLFSPRMSQAEMHDWLVLLAAKDAAFAFLFAIRYKTKELPIMCCFFVSCLFHQYLVIEVNNQTLTLFHSRPDIMAWLVSGMLSNAIILIMGGGWNGGKRAKRLFFRYDSRLNGVFYTKALKDQ